MGCPIFDEYSKDEIRQMLANGDISQDEAKNLASKSKSESNNNK
jgi:hypothetical protein